MSDPSEPEISPSPELSQDLLSSSPPAQPSTTSYKCVCAISEITDQLSNENSDSRFRCLAFTQFERNSEQIRCGKSFKSQSKPSVLDKAKQILQQSSLIDSVTFTENVARILFCTIHSRPKIFKQYCDSLREHWKGDYSFEEAEALKKIRQAFGITLMNPSASYCFTFSAGPLLPSPGSSARPKLEAKSYYSSPQPRASQTQTRDHITTFSRPQRTRSFSNPSLPQHEIGGAGPSLDIALAKNDTRAQISPKASPTRESSISSSSNPELEHQPLPLQLRQARDLDKLPIFTPKRITKQLSFSKDEWANLDFKSAFNSSTPRSLAIHVQSSIPNTISKDDIILNQASSPESSDTSIHPQIPTPDRTSRQNAQEPGNKPDERRNRFVDHDIRKMILENVPRGGHVYVLKAPNYFAEIGETPCVKIGIALDVNKRITQLKNSCGLEDLERVRDPKDRPLYLYERVEQLAHAELANFKRILKCGGKCKPGNGLGHKEWFAVSEDVALKVVQRWRDFIEQDPYDRNGRILTQWSIMLYPEHMNWQGAMEKDDDHEERDRRWTDWLQEGKAKKD